MGLHRFLNAQHVAQANSAWRGDKTIIKLAITLPFLLALLYAFSQV